MNKKQQEAFVKWVTNVIEYVREGFDIDVRRSSQTDKREFNCRARGYDGGEAVVTIDEQGRVYATATGERVV